MEGEAIVEDVLSGFFGGEGDEGEISFRVRFGERKNFYLTPIIVWVPHEAPKYIQGRVIAEGFSFEVESHVLSLGDELKAFLHLADGAFAITHFHDEGSFSPEKG